MKRLLIIEDDAQAYDELVQALHLGTNRSLHIDHTTHAQQAFELLSQSIAQKRLYDAILTDGFLEGPEGGQTVVFLIRDTMPEYAAVPIIGSSSIGSYFDNLVHHPLYSRNFFSIPKLHCGPRQTCWDDTKVEAKLLELNVL